MTAGQARRPPIGVRGTAEAIRDHLGGPRVSVGRDVLKELRSCTTVDDDPAALAEAGRDWWPISLHWAQAGEVAARPAAVARPASVEEVAEVLR